MADCNKFNVHRIDTVSTVPGTYKQDTYYQFSSLYRYYNVSNRKQLTFQNNTVAPSSVSSS